MTKFSDVKIWGAGVMALTLLAGCATHGPSMAPMSSSAALRDQDSDAQQATMGGVSNKAKDKVKDKDKAKEKGKAKDKDKMKPDSGQQPCPPAHQMSGTPQASASQPCPPDKKEKAKAKMPGDKKEGKDMRKPGPATGTGMSTW